MTLIYGKHHRGAITLLCKAPIDFDVDAWAAVPARRKAFLILGITGVTYDRIEC